VAFRLETWRRKIAQVTGATMNLEHTRAFTATEMVVMRGTGALIASGLTGQRHGNEPTGVDERIDGAIHSRDTDAGDAGPCRI
jgi:hypothetical protein